MSPLGSDRRIEALTAVTDAALGHVTTDEVLNTLLERIRTILAADTAAVLLLDEARDVLVARAAKGLEEGVERGVEVPVGRGFAGRIAAERTPVAIDDLDRAEIVNPLLREKGIRTLLGVPLLIDGRVLGVLHAGRLHDRPFTEDDAELLQLVADRAALALEHARLLEEAAEERERAEAAVRRLAGLQTVTEAALAHLALDELLDALLERVREVLEADTAAVLILDEERDVLVARAAKGLEEEVERRVTIPVGAGFAGRVVAERRPIVVPDVEHFDVVNPLFREKGVRSLLGAPLVVDGRAIGVLHVGTLVHRAFAPADVELLQAAADRCALAIEHARLYEAERIARREAEQQRANAGLALDYVADGVVLVDTGDVIRFWNPAAEVITGISLERALGRRIADVAPGWQAVRERIPVARFPAPASALAKTVPVEIGGREIWLSISGVTFSDGTVYAFRDVTEERRLAEWQSQFIATVAHEFRTPMASVYGAAATLRREDVVLDDETKEALLRTIYSESERLARLVDDVLVASRLESGTVDLALTTFDPVSVTGDVIAAVRAHRPDVEIKLVTKDPVAPLVADPDKVKHVLVNLVENAVKYSPGGGTVEVAIEPRDEHVRFSVRDHGLGIPAREQPNIFKKFHRVPAHSARGIGGTGLGLYICREFVQRLEGRIWFSSTEGKGSTFAFELPACAPDGASRPNGNKRA